MLEIRNLRKTYPGRVQALRGISLTLESGMFGLLGPNGAGKSTLMKCVATLLEPDDGEISVYGLDGRRNKEAVRLELGYLPQDFGFYPTLTAEEMLDYLAVLKGLTERRERRNTVAALLERVNLASVKKRRLGGFSGGMRQRFGIAQALLGTPRLLVVDEPTAGLDPQERNRFHNLLAELATDIVVLLSTHIVSDVTALCHKMAIIKDGLIVHQGTPVEAVEAMRGRVWERTVPRGLVDKYRARLPVISANPSVQGTQLRVLSAGGPPEQGAEADGGFVSADPTLEDVYFNFTAADDAPDTATTLREIRETLKQA